MENQTQAGIQTSSNHVETGTLGKVRSRINDGIDSATNKIGEAVEDNANTIAHKTQDLLSSVAHGGQYLRQSEPKTLGADLVAVVKRHPILALAMGAGFGLFVAKMMRR